MKMIVCVAEDFGIGNNNGLLFSLPPDMKFFRETTMGKVIIMGRGTLHSRAENPLKTERTLFLQGIRIFQERVPRFFIPRKKF